MDRVPGNLGGFLLVGALSLLLGPVCPQVVLKDAKEICMQPPDKGPCRAFISRWYYDKYTQTCKEFVYGGCNGNDNNFMSPEDCWKTCRFIPKVPKVCRPEPDQGPCRGLFARYFFNMTTMTCDKFTYGGCYGNTNRFDNRRACVTNCLLVKRGPSLCFTPKDEGPCSAAVPRFYYNVQTKKCEQFNYTGCGGNENNFVTKMNCSKVCSRAGQKIPPRTTSLVRWKTRKSHTQA